MYIYIYICMYVCIYIYKIVAGWNATKPPSEGTVSMRHCLFKDLKVCLYLT